MPTIGGPLRLQWPVLRFCINAFVMAGKGVDHNAANIAAHLELLCAQCLDGVDFGGAAGGYPRSSDGHYRDCGDRCGDGHRVERAQLVKQALENARGAQGNGNAYGEANEQEKQRLA